LSNLNFTMKARIRRCRAAESVHACGRPSPLCPGGTTALSGSRVWT
jgi:hypothetical protein